MQLKRQLVALSEMKRSVFGKKSFHLQYNSFQIGNETKHFDNETGYCITKKDADHRSPTRNESYCKRKIFVTKADRFVSERATSYLFRNGACQNLFINA